MVKDKGRGANWARNEGFKQVDTEFVLFSDNDIKWKEHGIESLLTILDKTKANYSYGRYMIGDQVWSHQQYDPQLLKKENYISTMSLWRTKDFPGFDENIVRLQDWDVYLTAMEQGKRGVYCNDLVFTTDIKEGITYDENLNPFTNYLEAERIIKLKHGIIN